MATMRTIAPLLASIAVALLVGCGSDDAPADPGATSASSGAPAGSGGAADGGSGGAGAAGGGGGDGGGVAADPCGVGEWTCVPVGAAGPYGERTFDVPAAQNWVNTGLFLKAGETATVTAAGEWQVNADDGQPIDHGPCLVADLVARIGLHYEDTNLTCIDAQGTVTADKDGILFLGALPSNDLGETYETRLHATGKKTVTVTSEGDTVPTVQGVDAVSYDFAQIASGWVEVWGEHAILTLPVATATLDKATLAAATARLDAMYELHEELRHGVPHNGQRLRFFPDGTNPGYMLAGNPIRMQLDLVSGTDVQRISRVGEPGADAWGPAHEMGHDFSFVGGFWTYQQDTLESWTNVFSWHAFEKLGLPLHDSAAPCNAASTGTYVVGDGEWDPWTGLCFLMQFQFAHGWDFYEAFFTSINDDPMPEWTGDWETTGWYFVHQQFTAAAGEDVTPVFDEWGVPSP